MRTSTRTAAQVKRTNARGGIAKRAGRDAPRIDKDGDLNMDTPAGGKPRPRGRPNTVNKDAPKKDAPPPRRSGRTVNTSNIQKILARDLGKGDTNVRGKAGVSTASALREAARNKKAGPLVPIDITGWADSMAKNNPDGGVNNLIAFLERKSNAPGEGLKITKSKVAGDTLTVFIIPEHVASLLHIDGFQFAGSAISVKERKKDSRAKPAGGMSEEGQELKDKLKAMLSRRYDTDGKLLDLSRLGQDPEFANSGMFDSASTQSKFFPALMKVCDSVFTSATQKREAVWSVSLANNNLPNVASVTTLAQTLPDTKNLDLSGNNFQNLDALEAWRRKFRSLEHLIVTGNPFETSVPNYHETLMKWYPTLRMLNGTQVRTDEQVAEATRSRGIPVLPEIFRDESAIAENFIKHFFPNYDNNRTGLIADLYDDESTFSLNVNVKSPHAPDAKLASWDQYLKKSRNLTKITSLPARVARSFKGQKLINDIWATLPPTRHPDLLSEKQKWCIECHYLPRLPDATGQSTGGVGGLIVMVHGEFGEVNVSTNEINVIRSFDRTFTLGNGGKMGVRVVNDVLSLRAYGGYEGWKVSERNGSPPPAPAQPGPVVGHPGLTLPEGFGVALPGKPEGQDQKELLALELTKATNMTLQYSIMCLEQVNWDLQKAGSAFQEVKATLPPEAFIATN